MPLVTSFYLAAPFFNPAQIELVGNLETLIRRAGFELFSPRESGLILKNMTPEERRVLAPKVFDDNVRGVLERDAVFAVIDDRDPGVMIEIGMAWIKNKYIYTYTDHDYGLNVMIQDCTDGHARGLDQAARMLDLIKNDKSTAEYKADAAT